MASIEEISNSNHNLQVDLFGGKLDNKTAEPTLETPLDKEGSSKTPVVAESSINSLQSAANMFSEVFDNKGGELESSSLEDTCLFSGGVDKNCKTCS